MHNKDPHGGVSLYELVVVEVMAEEAMQTQQDALQTGATVTSVEEIVELFQDVDLKIQALHRCSADDFLGLNAKFKNFYKESKSVSNDANALLELFSREKNDQLKTDLQTSRQELQRSYQAMKEQHNETMRIVHDLREAMNAYLFPLRHINNEFAILNMELVALDVSSRASRRAKKVDTILLQQMIHDWESFVFDITETKKLSQAFLEDSEYSLNHVELMGVRGLKSLATLLDIVEQGEHLFGVKQKEASINLPAIHEKSDSCAKSIADVITSLQYQDIIRQKMEHIQQAHLQLLEDLKQFDLQGSEDAWTHVLVQVRDIAALQAAQLLATNQEYQKAIESIARHFRTIAKEMTSVASICRSTMSEKEESEHRSAITDLTDRFKRTDALLARILDFFPECTREVLQIRDGALFLQKRITNHLATFFALSDQVLKYFAPFRNELGAHYKRYMRQVESMLNVMRDNMGSVSKQNAIIFASIEGLSRYAAQLAESELLWNYVQVNVKRAHSLSENLLTTEKESNSLLGKIETTCRSISDETQAALAAVRYYDFFENVIAEIVKGLSEMSAKICENVDLTLHGDVSNVRDLYTMESERKVHDQFTGETQQDENPDDDLELF